MRLIDATSLLVNSKNNKYITIEEIARAPEVDPITHGQWKRTPVSGILWCTACGELVKDIIRPTPFCPLCGAMMDTKER